MSKATTKTQENFPRLKSSELVKEMLFTIQSQEKTGTSVPMMIWGQPGAGKSDIIKSVGKKTGRPVIDIRLLLKDPTDLSGIPYINSDGEMGFAAPSDLPVTDDKALELKVRLTGLKEELAEVEGELPKEPSEKELAEFQLMESRVRQVAERIDMTRAIILLDELSSAPGALQAAALQLVLDRQVGTYKLPNDVVIFAAGNRASDRTQHHEMPMPLRNRMRHLEILIDPEEWVNWAVSAKVHPSIVGLIKGKPTLLNKFTDALKHQQYAFPTPRSWKFCSDVLYESEALKDNNKTIHSRISSIIGTGVASEFQAHMKFVHKLPSPESIATGKETHWDKDLEMSAAYTMVVNTMYWVKAKFDASVGDDADAAEKESEKHLDNIIEYMMKNFDDTPELTIMGVYMIFHTYDMSYDGKHLDTLLDEYGDFISVT